MRVNMMNRACCPCIKSAGAVFEVDGRGDCDDACGWFRVLRSHQADSSVTWAIRPQVTKQRTFPRRDAKKSLKSTPGLGG